MGKRHTFEECVTDWSVIGTTEKIGNAGVQEAYGLPGTYNFRLTVTYSPTSGNPMPSTVVFTKSVTVGRVDGVKIIEDAAGVKLPPHYMNNPDPASTFLIKFRLTSGGEDCGAYLSGTAEEKLTDYFVLGFEQEPEDWGGNPVYWYRTGPDINDHKWQTFASQGLFAWQNLPSEGSPVTSKYKQHIRFKFTDNCNNEHVLVIGAFEVEHHKVNPNEYDVTIVED